MKRKLIIIEKIFNYYTKKGLIDAINSGFERKLFYTYENFE